MKSRSPSTAVVALTVVVASTACQTDLQDSWRTPDGLEQDSGVQASDCPTGTYASLAAPGECEACEVGTYCAVGSAMPEACIEGTWDHDADPKTRCEPWTNCSAGQYVVIEGSPSRDRSCVPCEPDSFSFEANALACTPFTACEAGRYVRVAGTQDRDQVCGECATGTFSAQSNQTACEPFSDCAEGLYVEVEGMANADRQCTSCPEGTFNSSPGAVACVPYRVCDAGTFVESPGTDTTDRVCSGCPSGSYAETPNADTCVAWTNCQEGQYVSETGSAAKDRSCEECPPDTFSVGINSGACVAVGQCPPGTVDQTPGTDDGMSAECEACSAGEFCAGGEAEAATCNEGEWDDDADPATPCSARTLCAEGEYVAAPGSPTGDRTCTTCPEGTFSNEPNAAGCTEHRHCPAGTYVTGAGTSTSDRACSPCDEGTFTSAADQTSCTGWTVCSVPDSFEVAEPSASQDRECGACELPEVTVVDNSPECIIPVFQMSDDSVVMEAESFHFQEVHRSSHSWGLTTAMSASGQRCMDIGPDAGYSWSNNIVLEYAPRLDFRVNFTSTGTFYIHLRGSPGSTGAASDSCYAGVDGSLLPMYDFDDQAQSWSWRQQSVTVNTTGEHVLSVWGSDDGFCLDKVVVSTSATAPSGTGPAESPQE